MSTEQETYNWILNIIDSCNNDFHFEAIDKLIELFKLRVNDDVLYTCLQHIREIRWNNIHSIIK